MLLEVSIAWKSVYSRDLCEDEVALQARGWKQVGTNEMQKRVKYEKVTDRQESITDTTCVQILGRRCILKYTFV